MVIALSAQPMHVPLHGGCQAEVQSNPTVAWHCDNQIVNQNVTYELDMVAYCCISAFRGQKQQDLKHKSNLSPRAKLIQNDRKRMIFLKVSFPLS